MEPAEWSPQTTYPKGARVTLEGKTYQAAKVSNGCAPDSAKSRDLGIWHEVKAEPEFANCT